MSSVSARATCADWGKTFAVPDPTRTYTCKACGGPVRVVEPASEPETDGASRRAAAAELQRALNVVVWLRRLLAAGAIAYGLITVYLLVLLPKGLIEEGELLRVLAGTTVLSCMHVVGFRQARLQPLLWTLVLAGLATLSVVLNLLRDDVSATRLIVPLSSAAALWTAVPNAWRVRARIAAHPELYSAHRLHGTDRRRHGARTDSAQSLQQFARVRRRTAVGSAIWASGMALAVLAVVLFARPTNAGVRLESGIAAFEEAWRDADADGLLALSPPEEVEARRALIELVLAEQVWGERWPALGDALVQREPSAVTVVWPIEGGEVGTCWTPTDGGWWLGVLVLPLPSFQAALGRFADAWLARDLQALAALYPPDKRESAAESLARVVERRAWGEAWPGILEIEVGQVRLERTTVGFHVPGDEITTRWAFLDEHGWSLTSVKLPE
jgi:hypothetical protein